jgi:hypothetical protein
MNAKKFVSFSSTAAVFCRLHVLHGVEWEYIRLKNLELRNDLFQKTVPEVRLECLKHPVKIPVALSAFLPAVTWNSQYWCKSTN